jgi:hypothetical protein
LSSSPLPAWGTFGSETGRCNCRRQCYRRDLACVGSLMVGEVGPAPTGKVFPVRSLEEPIYLVHVAALESEGRMVLPDSLGIRRIEKAVDLALGAVE